MQNCGYFHQSFVAHIVHLAIVDVNLNRISCISNRVGVLEVVSNIYSDYKRIEWASQEKSRDKLNKSNGGAGI